VPILAQTPYTLLLNGTSALVEEAGGCIIAEGTPEAVVLNKQSHTARFLKEELA